MFLKLCEIKFVTKVKVKKGKKSINLTKSNETIIHSRK